MYDVLFNEELQQKMMDYFLNHLANRGTMKVYSRNEIIDPETAEHIYIVLEGAFNQVLYSHEGDEISFFRLERGTIFGEMDYFDGDRTCVITKALKASKVAIVDKKIIEEELQREPELYRQFMHSMIRKYRIVMLELADVKFNDSLGKLAHALLRLAHTTNYRGMEGEKEMRINMTFTHEELANRTASNRTTITNGLKYFKEKGLIEIKDKYIHILDLKGLKAFIIPYWNEE